MKNIGTLLLIVIVQLTLAFNANAQKDITYNFDKNSFNHTQTKFVYKKDQPRLHIINVNRLVYDITANGVVYKYHNDTTNIFNRLLEQTESAKKAKNNLESAIDTIQEASNKLFVTNLKIKEKTYNDIIGFLQLANNIQTIVYNECCSQERIINRIKYLAKQYNNQTPDSLLAYALNVGDNIKQQYRKFSDMQNGLKTLCEAGTENEEYCKIHEVLKTPIIEEAKLDTGIVAFQDLMAAVEQKRNFELYTPAFDTKGDEIKISAGFTPKANVSTKLQKDSASNTFLIKNRVGVAIGPTLTFHFGKSAFDHSFYIDSVYAGGKAIADSFKIIRLQNRNCYLPHIGLMANFFLQKHTIFTPGISLGISTSVADFKQISTYLGGAALLGNEETRIIINAGIVGSAVNRLRGEYIEGANSVKIFPLTNGKLPDKAELVEKVFKFTPFIGITYKLN